MYSPSIPIVSSSLKSGRYSYFHDGNTGCYDLHQYSSTSIEDRGYLFADAVYEVILLKDGVLIDAEGHWQRFENSLNEVAMKKPMEFAAMKLVLNELIRRNRMQNALVYMHATRGIAKRNHVYSDDLRPCLMMMLYPLDLSGMGNCDKQCSVTFLADERWNRCNIKSTSLLPNVLAKNKAADENAYESWLINEAGYVTEASASNAFIINDAGELQTHPATEAILGGITRDAILRLARENNIKVREEAFTKQQALSAKEAFISSSTVGVMPVIKMDGKKVGNGKIGTVTKQLHALYFGHVNSQIVKNK